MTGIPFHPRRDPLVGSAAPQRIIHRALAGMTGTPLRTGMGILPPVAPVASPWDQMHTFFFSEPKSSTLRPTGRCRSKGQLSRILGKLVDRCFPFRTYANTMEETTIEELGPGLVGGADERREI